MYVSSLSTCLLQMYSLNCQQLSSGKVFSSVDGTTIGGAPSLFLLCQSSNSLDVKYSTKQYKAEYVLDILNEIMSLCGHCYKFVNHCEEIFAVGDGISLYNFNYYVYCR